MRSKVRTECAEGRITFVFPGFVEHGPGTVRYPSPPDRAGALLPGYRRTANFLHEFLAEGRAQIRDLQFAFELGKTFGDQGEAVALLLFQRNDLADEVALGVPGLQQEAAVPLGNAPLFGDQSQGLFARVKQGGLRCSGHETFDDVSQLSGSLHATRA
jgi:hypothetical protein